MVLRTVTICSGWTMRCGSRFCVSSPLFGSDGFCYAKLVMLNRNSMERKETFLRQAIINGGLLESFNLTSSNFVFSCEILRFCG